MDKKVSKYGNQETAQKLIQLGLGFCIAGSSLPLFILLLRFIDYDLLLKISPGEYVMNPLSSISYILIGISIWLVRTEETMQKYLLASRVLCIIVIGYCVSVLLLSFILHINYEPDLTIVSAIFKNPKGYGMILNYKSMVINNAIGLCFLSISIIFINHQNTKLYSSPETLNYLVIWGAFLIIYGYLYSLESLYASFGRIPMSFYSAVILLLLSSAVLLLRPYKGTMAHLIGESPADVFMIRFMAFFIPLIIGYIKIQGVQNNLFSEDIGKSLLAISTYIIAMTILGWKSTVQHKLQIAKKQKNKIIKRDREKMERILNNSQTYIQIVDIVNERLIFSNKIGKEIFPKENDFEGIKSKIHPDDTRMMSERRNKILPNLKDDEYDDIVLRMIDNEGKIFWFFSRAMVYKRKNGKVEQIINNSIDITKEKEEEAKLGRRKKNLEKKNNELEQAKEKLKKANESLDNKAKKYAEDLYESKKKYEYYIRNSFEAIIQYKNIGGDIDVSLPIKEQVKLIKERTVIKEVNKVAANIHGFNDPKDMENMKLIDFLEMSEEQTDDLVETFIKNDYKLIGKEPFQLINNGEPIKVYINVFGVIINNKLVRSWETQTKSEIISSSKE